MSENSEISMRDKFSRINVFRNFFKIIIEAARLGGLSIQNENVLE